MKKLIILFFSIVYIGCFSQNVKCEMTDYVKKLDDKEYSTYNYVNASYSYSRPLLILVTDTEVFMKIHTKIPSLFSVKQEYTDINLLGIKGFNKDHISEIDNKIISIFIQNILRYRTNNNLPLLSEDEIQSQIKYLEKEKDICNVLICKKNIK